MTLVLELGGQGKRFARSKTAVPFHALVGQYGLLGGDSYFVSPGLSATNHLNTNLELGAILHPFSNDKAEGILQCDGATRG